MKIVLGIILALGVLVGGFFLLNSYIYNEKQADTVDVYFYFPQEDEFITPFERPVIRALATRNVEKTTIELLLLGPTDAEKTFGAYSPFTTTALNPNAAPLHTHFNKLSVQEGSAVLDFDVEALEYLNGPAAQQEIIKGSIERTMTQFESISNVEYSIDGEIFDAWDA